MPAPATLHESAPPGDGKQDAERVYALYRGPGSPAEMLTINERGTVTKGTFAGVRIGDLLRTAASQGWLAYRHRPDGW